MFQRTLEFPPLLSLSPRLLFYELDFQMGLRRCSLYDLLSCILNWVFLYPRGCRCRCSAVSFSFDVDLFKMGGFLMWVFNLMGLCRFLCCVTYVSGLCWIRPQTQEGPFPSHYIFHQLISDPLLLFKVWSSLLILYLFSLENCVECLHFRLNRLLWLIYGVFRFGFGRPKT